MKQGIYEQLINEKIRTDLDAISLELYAVDTEELDEEDAKTYLSAYIGAVTKKALALLREDKADGKLLTQITVCNQIIKTLSEQLHEEEFMQLQLDEHGEVLTSIYEKLNSVYALKNEKPVRPVTSISQSSLFTGSKAEPNMLEELRREILTADEIDWLVSFVKWSGTRIVLDELRQFTLRGGKLRVITTSYMEATDYKALEELSKLPNTEIRVSLDKERTRLHAKAYLFKRETGFSTAYIGSSNLSNPALTSGLEWNLKVTEQDSFDIIRKFKATFESYWNDEEFQSLSKERSWLILRSSLTKDRVAEEPAAYHLDIRPYYYQQEILDELQAEREVHGRFRNLVVAATGVGKTVISAFDFKRILKANPNAKLLFIAHREEILTQSLATFRAILKDANFGELFVGQHVPSSMDHLFMSIQSWNSKQMATRTSSDFYDTIIVDEFHHAAAPTYQKLLKHYEPKVLLGLTATPERMDQQSILTYFDDYIASEMRLTEAINRKLLSPFHYFCVTDIVDLSSMKWSRRGYDTDQLTNLYTSNDRRSDLIIQAIHRYVTSIDSVKGLGFCVSVEHAVYMAKYFNRKGIPSIALHGKSADEERETAKRKLESGEIRFIFVVDLYNEGVDIPVVNTILFLRPTESLTVFLQQLGRGLRLHEDKECLTVLDFIGQAHKDYPFEEKFRALVGPTKHSIRHYVENGFSYLPKGSVIQMEKQAKDYILRNVKAAKASKKQLVEKLRYFEQDTGQPLTLLKFLKYEHLTLHEFYGTQRNRTFEELKAEAGLRSEFNNPYVQTIKKQIHKLFHLDSQDLIQFIIRYVNGAEPKTKQDHLMVAMFYYSFYRRPPNEVGFESADEALRDLLTYQENKSEILSVLEVCYENIHHVDLPSPFVFSSPLRVHGRYTTDQIMAAFDYYNDQQAPAFREGVKHFEEKKTDVFFITLNKSDKEFSESTMYEDYAISDRLFHWQSQSRTSDTSPTAQRYIHHQEKGHQIALFVREYKVEDGFTSSFTFLGTANYLSHEGSQPVSFIWELDTSMPAHLVPKANKSIL
ncbi:DEAD/DEAH box helicase [Bhargavaea beijingensis]|uniref:DUF3427 domain-containing protein n=1 Tax=Bhargavaea beijingensis TaxID=426756 RepID=A0ABX9ZDX6_9BACL|nr:DUF3427 domain-containing protein [Bhargavaea beijingensis]RSK34281.1 DUF3427 domain-containing protein [Bhargavaea beijingensis]